MPTPPLEVVEVAIDDLVPADYNPRKIDRKKAAGLARSLEEFGFLDPVVINRRSGRVVGGHQRINAARSIGRTTVPAVYVDLDDDREKALNLALNQYVGEWDLPKLVDLLDSLDDGLRDLAGFDADELQAVRFHWRRQRRHGDPDADRYGRDNHPTLPEHPNTRPGDIYRVGVHLVICADSTNPDVWAGLDTRPRLVVTSPPYPGAAMWNTAEEGDDKTANIDRLNDLNATVLDLAVDNADVVCWNVCDMPVPPGIEYTRNTNTVRNHLDAAGVLYREIIWDKGIPTLPPNGHSRRPVLNNITNELVFVATHQPVFVVYPDGWKPREPDSGLTDGTDEWQLRSVWNITPARRSTIGHPAPFPVELAERCILLYSLPGDLVVDPFAGAGTVLLAAENTGRTAALIERAKYELDLDAELVHRADGA